MKRHEAFEIVKNVYGNEISAMGAKFFVRSLEELGLLKTENINLDMPAGIQNILSEDQIKELGLFMHNKGWKFVQK